MMTQSVMTQAAAMFANTSGSVTLKGKQTGNDFSMLFGDSLKSAQASTGKSNTATVQKAVAVTDNAGTSNKSDDVASDVTKTNAVQDDNAVKTVTQKASDQRTTDDQTDSSKVTESEDTQANQTAEPVVDEQLTAQLAAMMQTIGQAVMDQLKLSPEEFNQLLTDQKMNLTDLLNPENLQQLVIANSGTTDILKVLTDENLADTMKQLIQTVENIVKESNTGLTKDQIKALVEQIKEQTDIQTPIDTTVTEEPVVKNQTEAIPAGVKQTKAENTSKDTDSKTDKTPISTSGSEKSQTENNTAKAGTADTASNSDSNNKSDREYAADRFQTFVDNLVKASQNPEIQLDGEMAQTTSLREIANQIVDRIKVTVSSNQTSMELQLNPESLGKVNLTVQSKGGVLTAHFVVQNEISKEAIESQLQTLRDTLHEQGVKVEAIEVTVSANAFEQNSNKSSENDAQAKESSSGRKLSLDDALNMTDIDLALESPEEITGMSGSVINYTA